MILMRNILKPKIILRVTIFYNYGVNLINMFYWHFFFFFKGKYKALDDGIDADYQYRLKEYEKCNPEIATDNDDVFHCIDGDYFKMPTEIWEKLYK